MQSVINILFHSQIRQQNEMHTAFHVDYKGSKAGNRRTDLNTKALSKHPPLDEVHYKHMWEIIRVSLKKQFAPTRSSRAAQIFTPPLFSVDVNESLGLAPGIDAWQQLKMSPNVGDEHMVALWCTEETSALLRGFHLSPRATERCSSGTAFVKKSTLQETMAWS